MKKNSFPVKARVTIGTLFLIIGVGLLAISTIYGGNRTARKRGKINPDSAPTSGTLNPTGPTVNWIGTGVAGGSTDESTCIEGVNCDTFMLTLSGQPGDWTGKKAHIVISCADPSGVSDYDLYVHKGS